MIRCKLINFLFRVFPVRAFQGLLIKKHFEECPNCQNSLAEREDARLFLVKEDQANEMLNIWPGIQEKLGDGRKEKIKTPFVYQWKWALSAAVLTVCILTGFWFVYRTHTPDLALQQDLDQSLKINYIKIEEKPAAPYVYESQDSEMIIVWAEILP